MPRRTIWEIAQFPEVRLTWGAVRNGVQHKCPTCGILLLTGERAGFCCGPNGSRFHDVKALPPLPHEFNSFINDRRVSHLSRRLNLILSFASLETTQPFPAANGPPGFVAIQGRVYHRVRPSHENSAVRWLLYDGFEAAHAPHSASTWFKEIPANWIASFRSALLRVNSFASSLRFLGQIHAAGTAASLLLEDTGTAEIAAIMSYSNTTQTEVKARRLIVITAGGENQSVSTVSRFWEPLSYPLLFPHGTLGWGVRDHGPDANLTDPNPDADLPTTQMWYYRARLLREPRFQIFGRLANEYMVDMFSRDLESRLAYIRNNQQRLRQNDALLMGSIDSVEPSENIYLPSSFLGSPRWASEQVSDSLAIAAAYGPPTFFITMTCDPQWPEIATQLRPGQTFADIPVVVVRVFKRKLVLLLQTLNELFPKVGRPVYCIHSIEFQKRGLPHAHILVKYPKPCIEAADIDAIISAEIPEDPTDAPLIRRYMMHSHPPDSAPPSKYCQRLDAAGVRKCRFKYPFPLQERTIIDVEGRVRYRRRRPGDEMIVPHCLALIRQFRCHINFEAANTSHMFQYIFKYIHKPGCSTRYRITAPDSDPQKVGRDNYFLELPNNSGSPRQHVILRSSARSHLSRIQSIRPSRGDLFYLRSILQTRPCRSFLDARTVHDTVYATYQEAANALGLFADSNEAMFAILEAVQSLRTPREIRVLFVHLLTNECVPSPINPWETFHEDLSRDFTLRHGGVVEIGLNFALDDIGRLLEEYGKQLSDYGLPEATVHELERWGPVADELETRANAMLGLFNAEQREIYTAILAAVMARQPLCAFVDGKAGRGKTAMITALCDKLRSFNEIVIATATSAFAAQLYPGGKTTHSTFKVPVSDRNELLESMINPEGSRAKLIRRAALIVWDEAPTANRAVLACVDDILRKIMHNDTAFGGKVVVLLGDFRQTGPVVQGGSRAQIVDASIRSSPLWDLFTVFRLTRPIRNAEDLEFADFLDTIGDGAGPNVSLDLLQRTSSAESLLEFVYPEEVLNDPLACLSRAILAPTNRQVELKAIDGDVNVYLSADTFREGDDVGALPPASVLDYVARRTPPGLPAHAITIKTNCVFRLLRNFSIDRGLVKNTRAVVTQVGYRLITVRVLRAGDLAFAGSMDDEVLIPRICFDAKLPSGHTLLRRQFPLAPAYATTFNSCQGLTLNRLGVDLTRPVFSHGQLYTALSRIRHRSHAQVRLRDEVEAVPNVTYTELLL
uniref:ATP-dependent DNA helicase n=1 Tax=Mycena chlorophos TaxID=658473 RepID=A0ABQ0KXV7_MYCCL|nr:ATP-dependent DNA helicase [Mycena chlorophos]